MIGGEKMTEDRIHMAEVVPQRFARTCVFCFFSLVVIPLHAEKLPDPTRPPSGIYTSASGVGAKASQGGRTTARSRSSGLRTIIISGTRRAAIIDGKTVELGEKHGKARLIEVNEGSVVLQRAKSKQVLTLFPRVKITHRKSMIINFQNKKLPNRDSMAKQPAPTSDAQPVDPEIYPAAHREEK